MGRERKGRLIGRREESSSFRESGEEILRGEERKGVLWKAICLPHHILPTPHLGH